MNEVLTCPKCRGTMRTHMRQGVHVEQCDMCRGIFLDYGELESISRLGGGAPQQHMPAPPPMGHAPQQQWGHAQPGWGHGHHGHHHHQGFARMFFSS